MQTLRSSSLALRLRGQLPPSPPYPGSVQTLASYCLPFAYLEHCRRRVGDRFTLYPIDMHPFVFLADPQDIREVLTADDAQLHAGKGASVIAPLIGERSFMLLEEEEHIRGRREITPAFHQRMVAEHSRTLAEVVEREIASWPLNEVIALHPRIRSLTLRVILRIIFGDEDEILDRLHAQLMSMLSITESPMLQQPKLRSLPGGRRIWRRFLARRAAADALIYRLLERRRSEPADERTDLLDMLLAARLPDGSPLPDRKIRDDLMSMILAGHETTTGELSWAFQLLAHNPQAQSRLCAEIDAGQDDRYLSATVQETMRRKPVFVFAIPRRVAQTIEIGGWTYPPAVNLICCTYLMHHNPELYPDPYRFSPERFIEQPPGPRTWLPWGGGRKHCLGRHFALMEVKAILSEALSKRTVLPAARRIERPQWRSAILVPHAGGRVVLRERRN
ncbi:MAG TPA: cytochrome P450 [Solirubrobacteraceae bacterium]|jgi:cytochrome P450